MDTLSVIIGIIVIAYGFTAFMFYATYNSLKLLETVMEINNKRFNNEIDKIKSYCNANLDSIFELATLIEANTKLMKKTSKKTSKRRS